MFRHTVVRELPVPPADAYAWLTDYREDDLEKVLGDPEGVRIIERLGPDQAYAWLTDYSGQASAALGRGTGRSAKRIDEWRWELADTLSRDGWENEMRGKAFLASYGGRMKAHFERVYDRIVGMMRRELGYQLPTRASGVDRIARPGSPQWRYEDMHSQSGSPPCPPRKVGG